MIAMVPWSYAQAALNNFNALSVIRFVENRRLRREGNSDVYRKLKRENAF